MSKNTNNKRKRDHLDSNLSENERPRRNFKRKEINHNFDKSQPTERRFNFYAEVNDGVLDPESYANLTSVNYHYHSCYYKSIPIKKFTEKYGLPKAFISNAAVEDAREKSFIIKTRYEMDYYKKAIKATPISDQTASEAVDYWCQYFKYTDYEQNVKKYIESFDNIPTPSLETSHSITSHVSNADSIVELASPSTSTSTNNLNTSNIPTTPNANTNTNTTSTPTPTPTSTSTTNITSAINSNTTQDNTTQNNTTQDNITKSNISENNTTKENSKENTGTGNNTAYNKTTDSNTTQDNTTEHNTTEEYFDPQVINADGEYDPHCLLMLWREAEKNTSDYPIFIESKDYVDSNEYCAYFDKQLEEYFKKNKIPGKYPDNYAKMNNSQQKKIRTFIAHLRVPPLDAGSIITGDIQQHPYSDMYNITKTKRQQH